MRSGVPRKSLNKRTVLNRLDRTLLTTLVFTLILVFLSIPVRLHAATAADSIRLELRTLFYKAKAARDNQDWPEAAKLYQSLSSERQSNPYGDDATFWYAFCLQKAGDLQQAAIAYERYLETFPGGKYSAVAEARLRTLLNRLPSDERDKANQLIQRMRKSLAKETRRTLIEALSRGSSEQDVPFLITLLQREQDSSLRIFLIQTLGRSGEPNVVPHLVEVARQENNWQVRRAAISALGRIPSDNAYLELLQLMEQTRDPRELTVIVTSLASSGGDKSLPVLASIVRKHQDKSVRYVALSQIAHLSSEARWDTLVRLALDPSLPTEVRTQAVRILPVPLCKSRLDAETVRALLQAASQTGSSAFLRAVLVDVARVSPKTWNEVSSQIFSYLSPTLPPEIVSFALNLFAHRGMGQVEPDKFLNLCDRFDESPLRASVLRILKRHDPDLAVKALARLLEQEQPLPDLDKLVAFVPPDKGVGLLEEALTSNDPGRRREVVKALVFLAFRVPQAAKLLIQTAETDPDYEVRAAAFRALSRMNSAEAQEAVRRLADRFYR